MPDAGALTLHIAWNGKAIGGVTADSSRPRAYRLLAGKTPQQAAQTIPLLYSVCSQAQLAAAIAAMAAAPAEQHGVRQDAVLERAVACEAMQEHLWRLLLDWPQLLGLPTAQPQFVNWRRMLNLIATGAGDAQELLAQLSHQLLGLNSSEWRAIASYADLRAWWLAGNGLLAPLLQALDRRESELEPAGAAGCELLPDWTISDALLACSGQLDVEFAARPHNGGRPMEVGALAFRQHSPLLKDIMRVHHTRLLARLIARLADLLDSVEAVAQGRDTGRLESAAAADGAGMALVRTARGPLLHYVQLERTRETKKVAQYLVIAPTEWNFHPQGALANSLNGISAASAEQLLATARMWVLSLDPCVEYRIEVRHA
jgi:hypothetical protein